jgi:hypothetical protein
MAGGGGWLNHPWSFVGAKPPQKHHSTMFKIRQFTLKSKQFFILFFNFLIFLKYLTGINTIL